MIIQDFYIIYDNNKIYDVQGEYYEHYTSKTVNNKFKTRML